MLATVTALCQYPIKGLSAQSLDRVELSKGEGFPFDRIFALARREGQFDPAIPARMGKSNFLQLMKDDRLAGIQSHLDPVTMHLTARVKGRLVHRADVSTEQGREATAAFFAAMLELQPPRVVSAPGMRFTDEAEASSSLMNAISLINISSVRALSERIGIEVEPLRFRANVYVDGWPPFIELQWLDQALRLGSCPVRVVKLTERCAATEVNPRDARRDLSVPRLLMEHFGHALMGVYVQVIEPGVIARGDRAVLIEDRVATIA